jgi:uncharacterized membrane protein
MGAGDRHDAPLGVDFDTYQGVLDHADRIAVRDGDGTMPPGGGPSEEEHARLAEWIACGVAADRERLEER